MEEVALETKMKELMDFARDIASGLYYMGQTELCGSYLVDGKQVNIDIKLSIDDEQHISDMSHL